MENAGVAGAGIPPRPCRHSQSKPRLDAAGTVRCDLNMDWRFRSVWRAGLDSVCSKPGLNHYRETASTLVPAPATRRVKVNMALLLVESIVSGSEGRWMQNRSGHVPRDGSSLNDSR